MLAFYTGQKPLLAQSVIVSQTLQDKYLKLFQVQIRAVICANKHFLLEPYQNTAVTCTNIHLLMEPHSFQSYDEIIDLAEKGDMYKVTTSQKGFQKECAPDPSDSAEEGTGDSFLFLSP